MYYFRRFTKPSTLFRITNANDISTVPADVLKQEFGTTSNKLSFWRSESITDWNDAKRAILLSTTAISKTCFFAFDDKLLEKYSISLDFTELGMTAYKGAAELHVNLKDLDYGKIGHLFEMIKQISSEEIKLPKLEADEVKEIIRQVALEKKIDYSMININLFKDIKKYKLDPDFPMDFFEETIKNNCEGCQWYSYQEGNNSKSLRS